MQKKFRSTLFLLFSFIVLSGFSKDERTFTYLLQITAGGAASVAEELIRLGADINYADDSGFTALHLAASGNDVDLVELLIQEGADINAQASRDDLRVPLHFVLTGGWDNSHEIAP